MIVDKLSNLHKYIRPDEWIKIESFLSGLTASTSDGLHVIDGDKIFARVASYQLRRKDDCRIEAHDKYVDIQSSIIGAEGIDIFERHGMDIDVPYNLEDDVVFLSNSQKEPYVSVVNHPGYFTLIFPDEAHRPMQKPNDCTTDEPIKKFVIKIKRA